MILVVDIGNTSVSLGLYANGRIIRRRRDDSGSRSPGILADIIKDVVRSPVAGGAICSVVPSAKTAWKRAVRRVTGVEPLLVCHDRELGIPVRYPKPETIGADRLANACAAHRAHGAPVVVADFGTALTFDIVEKGKGYTGGIILPGLPLMFDYLADKTALLPHIEPGPVRRRVGKSTEEAMRIGARYGYRGMVREVVAELRKTLGRFTLCATGGYAPWVLKGLSLKVTFDKDLTLKGLGHIYELNRL